MTIKEWIMIVPSIVMLICGVGGYFSLKEDVRLMRDDIRDIKSAVIRIEQNHIDHLTQLHAKKIGKVHLNSEVDDQAALETRNAVMEQIEAKKHRASVR